MLGGKKTRELVSGSTTLISEDTTVVGDLHFSGNLDIEGLVQGNICAKPGADALVRVVGKGRVEGEIRAPVVVINAQVKGNVYSTQHLELAAQAQVEGSVYYTLVEMAVGSEVNGSLAHIDPQATDQQAATADRAQAGSDALAADQAAKVD